jgi:2-dehydro-3-deoxygluconokinase
MSIVTFGELLLRLSTPANERFVQASSFNAQFGGGEANVAVALAGFGLGSTFVTKVPDHEIGSAAIQALRRFGVSTQHVIRDGDRMGIYFLETGASQRPSKVIYDRRGSAISRLRPEELDWDSILEGVSWFHWTGITAALGANLQVAIAQACLTAKARGIIVSCDLNYRKKLWSTDQARAAMVPLMEHVDVCIANEEDAERCLGVAAERSDVEDSRLDEEAYGSMLIRLKQQFGFQAVAVTLRESFSASRNGWSAMLLDERDCPTPRRSRRYAIDVVDRVGTGDAFAAGLIRGFLVGGSTADALEFAVAASCLKHSIPGDFLHASVGEVEEIMLGGAGRVQR